MAFRILLADSNIATQNNGMKILAAAGHEVVTVSNGLLAIRKVAEWAPDMLLVDVYLPGYGGLEICERVKANPGIGTVSVLLIAGRMDLFSAAECNKAKADGFITKPFEAGELIATVERLLERVHPTRYAVLRRFEDPNVGNIARQSSWKSKIPELHVADIDVETTGRFVEMVASSETTLVPNAYESQRRISVASSTKHGFLQQGEEICDVCGHVNQEHRFVCQNCDVPLPSSVRH